ncbi:hypothetical protein BDZ94DRAFT_1195256 [Collybia nuda]|uniref:Uncharacterized protein n=1 Tax=Collybia nuda TaxID=64659 RepID=A0A9P5Y4B9_9AGAR|nr:hypothetical protein BDZ94DRAFT_1195256 [Collybia nuda]
MSTTSSRRTHRKRGSALRLSSDTTATLPEYITVGWHREEDLPSDRPPDYPDSAEEADEDTDSEGITSSVYVPPPIVVAPGSPRRVRRFPSHRRRPSTSSNDPYLDSLLARSVHALEMSNTLLQSSMSTQTSLSNILTPDTQAENTLETSARGLSTRIQGSRRSYETWADDLEEISREVEGLFDEGQGTGSHRRTSGSSSHTRDGSISSSLPVPSSPLQGYRARRRPSQLDLQKASEYPVPHLQLSQQDRSNLISPAPRALTQYFISTSDSDSIVLPSTLGLRCPPSSHNTPDWQSVQAEASSSNVNLHGALSSPKIIDRPLEPSTPAYNMLSAFVAKAPSPGSSTPSSFSRQSFLSSVRSSRNNSTSTDRTSASIHSRSSPTRTQKSPERKTPKQIIATLPHRPMTPTTEESSCSSDGCPAKLTVVSLRKILDDQPPPTPPTPPERPRPPAFLPRTPAPVAEAGTSTATASISRLFTKGKHSSSTRPQSPPRQSAMKQPSPSTTPAESPSTASIPDLLGVPGLRALGSAPSSGGSTPKRISFAELPESYAGSRPEGSSFKFRDKKSRRGKKGDGKEKEKDGPHEGGWWTGWLVGGSSSGTWATARQEERAEDKLSRTWSGRMGPGFGPAMDEWAM